MCFKQGGISGIPHSQVSNMIQLASKQEKQNIPTRRSSRCIFILLSLLHTRITYTPTHTTFAKQIKDEKDRTTYRDVVHHQKDAHSPTNQLLKKRATRTTKIIVVNCDTATSSRIEFYVHIRTVASSFLGSLLTSKLEINTIRSITVQLT